MLVSGARADYDMLMGHEKPKQVTSSMPIGTTNWTVDHLVRDARSRGRSNLGMYSEKSPSCSDLITWEKETAKRLGLLLGANAIIVTVPEEVAEECNVPADIMVTGFSEDVPEGEWPVVYFEPERHMTMMKFCHLLALGGSVELASRFGIELSA